jgi:hypothetical protein
MREEKFKVETSAGEVMASIFWGSYGIFLVEFSKICATISSEQYVQKLKKLRQQI